MQDQIVISKAYANHNQSPNNPDLVHFPQPFNGKDRIRRRNGKYVDVLEASKRKITAQHMWANGASDVEIAKHFDSHNKNRITPRKIRNLLTYLYAENISTREAHDFEDGLSRHIDELDYYLKENCQVLYQSQFYKTLKSFSKKQIPLKPKKTRI